MSTLDNPTRVLSPPPPPTLTPLEQEILDEYARLLENMNKVNDNNNNNNNKPSCSLPAP